MSRWFMFWIAMFIISAVKEDGLFLFYLFCAALTSIPDEVKVCTKCGEGAIGLFGKCDVCGEK